jgi:type IX secretion system PorP/SprF family membrane protein
MKKIMIVMLFCFFTGLEVHAQDIHFSQAWMTPVFLNPAQAGSENPLRAFVNYKNQWKSVASAYSTSAASLDFNLSKQDNSSGFSGFGINVFNDKAGAMKTFKGSLSYAYHAKVSEKALFGGGLNVGYSQNSIDYSSFQWMEQYDGSSYNSSLPSNEPSGIVSFTQFDVGAGLHFSYGKSERYMTGNDQASYSGGISVTHINRPSSSFYKSNEKLDMKTTSYANAMIGMGNSNLSLVPGIVYAMQGKMSELLVGSLFRYAIKDQSKYTGFVKATAFSLGAYYRNRDAVIASALFEVDKYAIGLSYDVNVSGLKSASTGRGGFELALRYNTFPSAKAPQKSKPSIY